MKKLLSILCVLVLVLSATLALVSCNTAPVDYTTNYESKTNAITKKMFVTVRTYIDGDTTHFNVPDDEKANFLNGVLKARYLAVDTPESTGTIEEYGKQASNFTHDKLASVDANDPEAIMLESNDGMWNADSTGDRHLVYVWYRVNAESNYRMLNLELLQNGLARAKNLPGLVHKNICQNANNQAISKKIGLYSGEPDPLYYYGDVQEMTLKHLRTHLADYNSQLVAFDAIVVYHDSAQKALHVESYDAEDDMWYGMYIYYGWDLRFGFDLLAPGNLVRFVGSVSTHLGNYQITDIRYDPYMLEDDPEEAKRYFKVHSENNEIVYPLLTGEQYLGSKTVTVDTNDGEEELKTYSYVELGMNAPVSLENLKVTYVSTTTNPTSSSKGAMTLTCTTPDGKTVKVRTVVLYEGDDARNPMVTADAYRNKTIDVKGFIDYYLPEGETVGQYQIKVVNTQGINVHD